MTVRTRFAPSPTGRLHLGHARAAFEAFGFARENDGTCLLRIEDIDHTRCRPDYTRGIYEDLDGLGLDWPLPVRLQSRHYADYAAVVIDLVKRGLAYPCTLTRRELKDGKLTHPSNALSFSEESLEVWSEYSLSALLNLSDGGEERAETICEILSTSAKHEKPNLPFAIRLNISKAFIEVSEHSLIYQEITLDMNGKSLRQSRDREAWPVLQTWIETQRPDTIIARRDIGTSYDIAVTHDDALQGITHVVRGRDLADQTPLHILIQNLMGWPTPLYYHHDLVLRDDGEKLAKRNLDTGLARLREAGQSVAEIKRLAGLT